MLDIATKEIQLWIWTKAQTFRMRIEPPSMVHYNISKENKCIEWCVEDDASSVVSVWVKVVVMYV